MEEETPTLEQRVVQRSSAVDLQCAICLNILKNPKQCKNGHLFCEECISQSIVKNPRCPTCRCHLSEGDLSRSLFVEKHLRTLSVWCVYHFCFNERSKVWDVDEGGCNVMDELQNIGKHESECGYVMVMCENGKMCGKIRKKDVEKHKEVCEWRLVECNYCNLEIQARKLKEHQQTCTFVPVSCDFCGAEMKRGDFGNHLQKDCPENEVDCPYSGCNKRFKRKNLTQHFNENTCEHLEFFRLSTQKLIEEMETNYQVELRRKDKEIYMLKKKLLRDTKIIWKIESWSKGVHKPYIQSKYFDIGGFEWFLGLYPDGDQESCRGFLSVYLFLKDLTKGQLQEKGKTILVDFRVSLINYKFAKRTIKKELKTKFPVEDGQGWGERQLVKTNIITEEAGFLSRDTLHFIVEIEIKQVIVHV